MKTLNDFNFKGKKVLLRSDLNSEVVKGKVILGDRIIESARTIKELKQKGARVVILAHQGNGEMSLKQHAKLLNKFVKVRFVDDVVGKKALKAVIQLSLPKRFNEVILLDNIRKFKDEFKPSTKNKLVKMFKGFDIYINDAFSVSHRNHTSIVSFPKVMKSGVGRLMQKELESLKKIKLKNCLFVLGGAKVKDKSLLIKKGNRVLVGGVLGFGRKKRGKNIIYPVDYVYSGKKAFDIGPKTIAIFKKEIKKAKCVFVVGPMGRYEDKKFEKGTRETLKAVASSKAYSVVGGGNTVRAMRKFNISKKRFNHVSLAGGALVRYVAGEELVGLEALKKEVKMKKKIKVLCICAKGQNRSRYLALYLRRQGYSTRFGGVEEGVPNELKQKTIDWADILIVTRKRLNSILRKRYDVKGKKIIKFDVTDSKRLIPEEMKHLRDLDYVSFQKKWTRPQLRKAIKPHLPLKRK